MAIQTLSYPLPSNATELTGWVYEPNGRGTGGILVMCVAAMVLCVWTALHVNIDSNSNSWQNSLRKAGLMLVTIYMPETTVFIALEQRLSARRLMKEVNALTTTDRTTRTAKENSRACEICQSLREKTAQEGVGTGRDDGQPANLGGGNPTFMNDNDSDASQSSCDDAEGLWTLDQAFFAVMGGYTIPDPSSPNRRIALTPTGVATLAKAGLLRQLPRVHIEDKSNASAIAKVLVCLQASFLVIQILARVKQGLDVTLLEIHVGTHVLCALVIYLIWFYKPYDVVTPVSITDQEVLDIAAVWALDWRLKEEEMYVSRFFRRPQYLLQLQPDDPQGDFCTASSAPKYALSPDNAAQEALGRLPGARRHFRYRLLASNESSMVGDRLQFEEKGLARRVYNLRASHVMGPARGYRSYNTLDCFDSWERIRKLSLFIAFRSLYGAGHLTGWAVHFPSAIERSLWRASALLLSCSCLYSLWELLISYFLWRIRRHAAKRMSERQLVSMPQLWVRHGYKITPEFLCFSSLQFPLNLLTIAWMLGHNLARIFILVEAFASLRRLSTGSFSTVSWLDFWPHL